MAKRAQKQVWAENSRTRQTRRGRQAERKESIMFDGWGPDSDGDDLGYGPEPAVGKQPVLNKEAIDSRCAARAALQAQVSPVVSATWPCENTRSRSHTVFSASRSWPKSGHASRRQKARRSNWRGCPRIGRCPLRRLARRNGYVSRRSGAGALAPARSHASICLYYGGQLTVIYRRAWCALQAD
jgi:hypothetical protein